jgi:23S rRNA (guanosine2251-2'-O)-methyltransferase
MEWIYGRQVVRLALAPGARRQVRRLAGTSAALHDLALGPDTSRVPVETVDTRALDDLTGSREHQGIAAFVERYPYAGVDEVLAGGVVVALDEVSDPRNLGAVARTALASGAGALVVARHRAAHITPAAAKASAGATEHLPIAQVTNLRAFLQTAQQRGYWVYGAAGDAGESYLDVDYGDRVVIVLGSEGRGLRRLIAETCDALVALPMRGPVTSLNVSVAAAVLLYELRRRDPDGPPARPPSPGQGRPNGRGPASGRRGTAGGRDLPADHDGSSEVHRSKGRPPRGRGGRGPYGGRATERRSSCDRGADTGTSSDGSSNTDGRRPGHGSSADGRRPDHGPSTGGRPPTSGRPSTTGRPSGKRRPGPKGRP